jgi:hypothetical protein
MKYYFTLFFCLFSIFLISCSDEENEVDFSKKYAKCNEEQFSDMLADTLSLHIEHITEETIDDRTFFLSYHPLRMTYQSFFSEDTTRISGWAEALEEHGLTRDSLNRFINEQIALYNATHASDKIKAIELNDISTQAIIDDQAMNSIKFMEWLGSIDVIHFLLCVTPGVNVVWYYTFLVCLFPLVLLLWLTVGPIMAMCDADEDTIKATISGIGKFFLGIIILGVFVVTTYLCINESDTLIQIVSNNVVSSISFK